jgi:hypothetical protein
MQYIPYFCENMFLESLFGCMSFLGFQYSNTRLAAVALPWCAKADSSLIHKICTILSTVTTRWLQAPHTPVLSRADFDALGKREDWKAAVLFFILYTHLGSLCIFLRKLLMKGKPLLRSVFLSVLQFVPLTGCLILMSEQSSQHHFLTSVLSLSPFLISSRKSFIVKLGIVIVVNVIANISLHIIGTVSVLITIYYCASLSISWKKKIDVVFQRVTEKNFCLTTFLTFFLCDLLVIFSVVCTATALFVPFDTFYEIMVYCWTACNFMHSCLFLLSALAYALFHFFGKVEAGARAPENSAATAAVGSAAAAVAPISAHSFFPAIATCTRNLKREIEILYSQSSFIPMKLFFNSMCIVFFNIVKGFIKLQKSSNLRLVQHLPTCPSAHTTSSAALLSYAPAISPHYSCVLPCSCVSAPNLMFTLCDGLCFVFLVFLHINMLKKSERFWSSLAILLLMDFNNLFYQPSSLEYHATPLTDLLSKSFHKEVLSFLPFLWSSIQHSAPLLKMVRLLFSEFFTMFEDAARLAPAVVLQEELDTCYIIDFAGVLHSDARLNFSPVYGSAFLLYQPLNNHSSIGAFAMNINGSTDHIPTTAWIPALLSQPLSMCFRGKTEAGQLQLYSVSSIVFRRFHQVKAELLLPSTIVFNTSLVPWVRATQWKATRYRESSLLPSRQRRGRLYCGSHSCRPVSLL